MSKISIVGVEGSGKTTLMVAFGEKYERPDELSQTFDYDRMNYEISGSVRL